MTLSRIEAAPLAFPLGMTMAKSKVWPAASLHDGISFSALTGQVTLKAPGGAPSVVPLASAFTFTGGNQSLYRGPSGLLIPSVTNTPRIEYGPGGDVLGLLMEASRTNLCLQSQALATTWTVTSGTVSTNAASAPDGTTTADKIVVNSGGVFGRVNQSLTLSATTVYTFSAFVKSSPATWVAFRFAEDASPVQWFDIGTGAVGTSQGAWATPTITAHPDGWYRITAKYTTVGTSYTFRIAPVDNGSATVYTSDGTQGLLVWGAQVELGAFASSYIPTTTVSVARTADSCIRTLSTEFSATAGTVVVAGRASGGRDAANNSIIWSLDDGTTNERFQYRRVTASDTGQYIAIDGGVQQAGLNDTLTNLTAFKSSSAWALNDFATSFNGAAVQTDAAGTLPTVTGLGLGSASAGGVAMNGHIRTFDYYPTRLTNAQLQQMSI